MAHSPGIEAMALQLWREREMHFPAYCRRMEPDDVDRTTDAWAGMLCRAERMMMNKTQATVTAIR